MKLFNVYRWASRSRPARAVRVWQGEARHGPGAIQAAFTAKPALKGNALFARCAHKDPYAADPLVEIED